MAKRNSTKTATKEALSASEPRLQAFRGWQGINIEEAPKGWSYSSDDSGSVVYQNNPILRWCLANTAKKSTNQDGIESIQPVKIQQNRRIDGMVSLLNAWVGYVKHYGEYLFTCKCQVRC